MAGKLAVRLGLCDTGIVNDTWGMNEDPGEFPQKNARLELSNCQEREHIVIRTSCPRCQLFVYAPSQQLLGRNKKRSDRGAGEEDTDVVQLESSVTQLSHLELEFNSMKDKIKENSEKNQSEQDPAIPCVHVIKRLDVDPNDQEEDGANIDLDSQRNEYDSRVKAIDVDERPTEQCSDIGGLDKQIQELVEAIVLPMNHKEKFENLGIQLPQGVLMYGPPGTVKTLLARAFATQTNATFLKLAGPQLVEMFIGDGANLVQDAFALTKEKAPSIIFIDELDAIGTKCFDSEKAGDREVQRTVLELLNQLDGFQPNTPVKVTAATNRVDILDPALLRSGRLDRKIEFPMPSEEAWAKIMQIHSRKMNVSPDVNYKELARCTDDFSGAQCKAMCMEAGMIALHRGAKKLTHKDYTEGILEVQAKKKAKLKYYA
ncbi:hypothetical protein GH733_000076 [Mirounga leonina]|nr:hypothetical protein GH733_000154 [Mirounga leonina]KAF3831339.1 hypothetical protein GH733_000076 [Mirounga leonina]